MDQHAEWNDFYHGNWPQKLTRPIVVKAGEGASYSDPRFAQYVTDAAGPGLDCFAYFALHAGTTAEMVEQAHFAYGLIHTRPAMYDVEEWPDESGSRAGIASLSQVCTAVDTYRADGGVMNVIYLPRSQWEKMGSPSLAPLARRGLHVGNADYRTGSHRPDSLAWRPYGGITPSFVQYAPCHNTAPGTWAQVSDWWRHRSTPPVPSPAPGIPVYTVREHDTFYSIAAAHHMTLGALEAMNPSAGHPAGNFDLIRPGDTLRVRA